VADNKFYINHIPFAPKKTKKKKKQVPQLGKSEKKTSDIAKKFLW
jgi:hypothetical protein